MSDLDQQLRDLLIERAARAGQHPPLPADLRGLPAERWWRQHRHWVVIPAAVLVTGLIVIPVALVSQKSEVPPLSASQAQTWAGQVCADRADARLPSQADVSDMEVVAVAVCRWEDPGNLTDYLTDGTTGLQGVTALSPSQAAMLQDLVADAEGQQPSCPLIDRPPLLKFYVYLRDASDQQWRLTVPRTVCTGFEMSGGHYLSSSLVEWLESVADDVKDLTGAAVGQALGLTPITDSTVVGCMRFTEYEEGAGYCLEGVTEDPLEEELLAMQIRGIVRDEAAIAYAEAMLKYRDAMDAAPSEDLIALIEKTRELSKDLTMVSNQSAKP